MATYEQICLRFYFLYTLGAITVIITFFRTKASLVIDGCWNRLQAPYAYTVQGWESSQAAGTPYVNIMLVTPTQLCPVEEYMVVWAIRTHAKVLQ